MKKNYHWDFFTRRIRIQKPIYEIYEAWALPGQIETWYLESADYYGEDDELRESTEMIQKGDRYVWKWHGWEPKAEGEVLAANGKDLIRFSFGDAGEVEIRLKEDDGQQTEVVLRQSKIPTTDEAKYNYHEGCSLGWSFWLVNLKAWLEFNVTLNETDLDFDQEGIFEYVNC